MRSPLLIALELPFSISSGKKIPEKGSSVVLEDYDLKALLPHHPLLFSPTHIVRNPIMATQPLGEANEQLWSVPHTSIRPSDV